LLTATKRGFQKNDVVKSSLDPDVAAGFVARVRRRSQTRMQTREMEIDAGLEHLTPAGEDHKRKNLKP
jgi:hypothetical protein